MRVERSGTIGRPVNRVFEYDSTPGNDPTWVPASLRHQKLSPGPMQARSYSPPIRHRGVGTICEPILTLGMLEPCKPRRRPSMRSYPAWLSTSCHGPS